VVDELREVVTIGLLGVDLIAPVASGLAFLV